MKDHKSHVPVAVIDANALFPMMLRDTLLRAAAAGCFRVHWSSGILDEVMRNLVDSHRMDATKVKALRTQMEAAFPDAGVEGWEEHVSEMRNHPKDRHVAAAAAAIGADIIVTSNVRDFADLPTGIVAMLPDQFLLQLLNDTPDELLSALKAQAAPLRRPPLSVTELLERLAAVTPRFVAEALPLVRRTASAPKPTPRC
jgi:predicted nucleic acid-binding protein